VNADPAASATVPESLPEGTGPGPAVRSARPSFVMIQLVLVLIIAHGRPPIPPLESSWGVHGGENAIDVEYSSGRSGLGQPSDVAGVERPVHPGRPALRDP